MMAICSWQPISDGNGMASKIEIWCNYSEICSLLLIKFHRHGVKYLLFHFVRIRTIQGCSKHLVHEVRCHSRALIQLFWLLSQEDPTVNRLDESLNLFSQIVNNRFFREASFVLFLNKFDLFREKILYSGRHLRLYFPDYKGNREFWFKKMP
jgi:hypothetical protein